MAMIEGHDYVTVISWRCPRCHKFYGEPTRLGRYPYSSKLHCNRGCGLEFYPTSADATYKE